MRTPLGSLSLAAVILLSGCKPEATDRIQGYVEGEFVYVASPRAGSLRKLAVAKGAQVEAGDPLFDLDGMPEASARDEARRKLDRAKALLEDAKKGLRPTELESAAAALEQARAALVLSESELGRQEKLKQTPGAIAEREFDLALSARDRDRQRVAELSADLETARLGSRSGGQPTRPSPRRRACCS